MEPTRRKAVQSETVTSSEPKTNGSSAAEGSSTAPEIPTPVLVNFVAFTLAMVILPIGSYFLSHKTVFSGNTTYSAALAALIANLVLVAFVVQALREDGSDKRQANAEGKKER